MHPQYIHLLTLLIKAPQATSAYKGRRYNPIVRPGATVAVPTSVTAGQQKLPEYICPTCGSGFIEIITGMHSNPGDYVWAQGD